MDAKQKMKKLFENFISTAAIYLPDDVEKRINQLGAQEDDGLGRAMYDCILENLELAKKLKRPLCQDTGVLQFFVRVGTKFPYIDLIEECLIEASADATHNTPLRPNVVQPLGEHNTGDNVGYGAPYIEWDVVPNSDELTVRLYMAGGGCSLPGRSKVLMPLEGVEGVKKYVYDTILDWGVNACPPLLVGIGLGTCAATSAHLSKLAILRPIGSVCADERGAKLERELTEELNSIGIAPLGFGGKNSVLAVHVECAGHHPATLGVGITTGCWATRRGTLSVTPDLEYSIPTHTGAKL